MRPQLGGAIIGHNLNELGRGPLGDAMYQISKFNATMVSDPEHFLSFHSENLFLAHLI